MMTSDHLLLSEAWDPVVGAPVGQQAAGGLRGDHGGEFHYFEVLEHPVLFPLEPKVQI